MLKAASLTVRVKPDTRTRLDNLALAREAVAAPLLHGHRDLGALNLHEVGQPGLDRVLQRGG